MGRRGNLLLGLVAAIAFVAVPASAAAPVKPKNGLYQGASAQYEPIGFHVIGHDSVDRVYFGLTAGTCEGFISLASDPQPISNRGRFSMSREFGGGDTYTVRGRFFEKTKARGRIVYTNDDPNECGVAELKVRFRVTRSTPPR